ncbi:hypothetical protein JCM10213_003628 [Rhodosporidiobolus nylandii]
MGIGGLLPLLKEIQKPCHVREWAGKTVAVDAYVWLHRGAYGCAEDLAMGKSTVKYVNYAMHRVRMLKYYGVTPILVFDGGLLPSKMGTEDERERKRTEALAKGRAFLAEGKASQARDCFVKAVDVTPAMAYQLIKALRREDVQYVVAPYEADPQLCYLEKAGLVDAIVTEDSDLLVFGCKNVLFKLDGEGNCVSISRDDFSQCREYNFTDWSDTEFRQMAILSGCDYLDSVVGLGLKTAYRLMRKYKTAEKVIQFVRLEGQLTVPRTYLDDFRRAELTFLHQHVFDPVQRKLIHLHPLPEGMNAAEHLPFIGPPLDEEFARALADGEIDPISKEAMVDLVPDSFSPKKPYQAEAFKPTASSSKPIAQKGKTAPAPVTGAGSILNFFSRQTARASKSAAVNPVKAVANQKRVHLVGLDAAKGKENEESAAPARSSRFFGSASAKSKGKERAVERAPAEEDEDEDAQAALLEVEMESVVAVSLAQGDDSTGDEGVITDVTSRSGADPPVKPSPPTPSRSTFREPSLPSCISSPSSTPPRKRATLSRASHGPSVLDGLPEEDEAEPLGGATTDGGISSPAESTRADAGWADDNGLSSPVAGPSSSKRFVRAKPAPSAQVRVELKQEDVKPLLPPTTAKGKKRGAPELSSDPIILSSDTPDPEQDEGEEERTPRPPPSKAKVKGARKPKDPVKSPSGKVKPEPKRERRSTTAAVSALPDAPVRNAGGGGSGRIKGKISPSQGKKRSQGEVEEEVDEAVKSVAASWRAKFMLPTPKIPQGQSAIGRSLLPTPTTTSRPPSLAKPAPATPSSPKKPARAATPASSTSSARLPLSPKSSNRLDRRPLLSASTAKARSPLKRSATTLSPSPEDGAPSSPAKKRRSSLLADVSAAAEQGTGSGGSSSPVVVTNPRLLAFQFRGKVSRD